MPHHQITLVAKVMVVALGAGMVSGLWPKPVIKGSPRLPLVTLAMATIVSAMFAAQQKVPALLPWLARDPAMLQGGQIWRAITALFVQDGGLAGALFNLTILLLVGSVAERRFGSARWLTHYLGGGLISEFLAMFWQPNGAGNSVACFALAGGMAVYDVKKASPLIHHCTRLASLCAGAALVVMHDVHGLAYWAGVVLVGIRAILTAKRPVAADTA